MTDYTPTARLRFIVRRAAGRPGAVGTVRILQQQWTRTMQDGRVLSEWRDIPMVAETASPTRIAAA